MNAVPVYGPAARRYAPPPWGNSAGMLALINFFGGGAVVFAVAATSLAGMWTEYDGILTLIGMVVLPVLVAIPSATAAFVIGLPIRLVPPIRRWWLRHGEYTLIGAGAGLLLVVVGTVLVRTSSDAGSTELDGWQVLVAGWVVFCICAMHLVWPHRWSGRGDAPIPPR
ncbi:MAG: hypothetical protein PIR02_06365 [Microbacterium enclense]